MRGDLDAAEQALTMLIERSANQSATFWIDTVHWMRGKMQVRRGEFAAGLATLRTAFATYDRIGWTVCYPEFMAAAVAERTNRRRAVFGRDRHGRRGARADRSTWRILL